MGVRRSITEGFLNMYRKNKKGQYRLRASFAITPELIERLNAICAHTGRDFGDVCLLAAERLARDFEASRRAAAKAP